MYHLNNLKEGGKMTESIRLNKSEKEAIRKKSIEINKALIEKGRQPMRDSEIIHEILKQAIGKLEITQSGNIVVNGK